MAETEGSQENIAYIRTHVDNTERMVRFLLSSNANKVAFVTEQFKGRKNSADVYMTLAKAPQNQDELVKKTNLSRATVSQICTYLESRNFIAMNRNPANKKQMLFSWTDAEITLDLSKIAKQLAK
ncbi:MAG TPA: MarR family transcriptional regulator [Candidatus Sulfotelmatobacter sp.]|jgi:DNA-binding MarR family transcriptional regulator|nr:MarR family transcriptional regulator [Candidatus Sulfotelmatobacter sp.]